MECFVGIDLGTSATKTILINKKGEVLATASYEYPLYQPHNGWAEQEPKDWSKAVFQTLKEISKIASKKGEKIIGIGLSGQMHGLLMLDENNSPIGRTIIWCDQRTEKQVEEMQAKIPYSRWLEITGNPPLAAWTAAKILWVKENEPEKYKKCKRILLPKDYIRFLLTGVFATDVSDASGMQLMDIRKRDWSDEILEKLQIDRKLLPRIYESVEVTGKIKEEIANEYGFLEEVIVVAGASDNAAAAIGTGVVEEGQAFTSIGTSAIIYTHLKEFVKIPEGGIHVCCSAVPGCYHTMGGPQSAGLSLEWFRNNFCKDIEEKSVFYEINNMVEKIAPGSDRLLYLPFLMGERTPHMNPFYRGAFIGLSAVHTKSNMLRAIMEGVVYSLADCKDILEQEGIVVAHMKVCGGGSKSKIWRQIMTGIYGCDVHRLEQEEGPAYGAAILAGVGSGILESIPKACKRFIKEGDRIKICVDEVDIYRKYHALYKKIYKNLVEEFRELSKL